MTESLCGYISIIGKPNVGKSTILNHILGKKISITSRKSQTTRNNILGIKNPAKNTIAPCAKLNVEEALYIRTKPNATSEYIVPANNPATTTSMKNSTSVMGNS